MPLAILLNPDDPLYDFEHAMQHREYFAVMKSLPANFCMDGIATRAIGRPSLLFDSGSLKRRFNRLNADIDLFLRQLAE